MVKSSFGPPQENELKEDQIESSSEKNPTGKLTRVLVEMSTKQYEEIRKLISSFK